MPPPELWMAPRGVHEPAAIGADGGKRRDLVRLGVHREKRGGVHVAQQFDRSGRARVGQVHLLEAGAGHIHAHAARTIERDGHRHGQLAVLLPHFHGYGLMSSTGEPK